MSSLAAPVSGGWVLPHPEWERIAKQAPMLVRTMSRYLDHLAERLEGRSVEAAEVCLRQFTLFVVGSDRSCRSAAKITAAHVTGWEAALSTRSRDAGEDGVSQNDRVQAGHHPAILRADPGVGRTRKPG